MLEDSYPRRGYAWTVVAILVATAVLSYTDRQVLSLLVDPIRADLGISDTDVARQDVNGWMWLMPDHRTVWLRSQRTNDPVVFYSEQDGKRREVHITGIGRDSVTGYLLLAN